MQIPVGEVEQRSLVLDNTLDAASSRQLTYPEMLADLLEAEVTARRERYLSTSTKLAHLPFQRGPGAVRLRLPALH